ncbi:MAG: hypothetical protein GKR90_14025 [Pseudomonadales bacterium]|nr:hypothetical protein [Pseudomonadales bacterium]
MKTIYAVSTIIALLFCTGYGWAKPSCPGHPSCKPDDGGGDPPVSSSPSIVYTVGSNGSKRDLYLMNADGSSPLLFKQGRASKGKQSSIRYQHGEWSPDGTEIAFIDTGYLDAIWVGPADNPSEAVPIFDSEGLSPGADLAWHPTEDWIALQIWSQRLDTNGNNVGDSDIWVTSSSGGVPVNLTSSLLPAPDSEIDWGLEDRPTWSPDGTQLLIRDWVLLPGFPDRVRLLICDFNGSSQPPSLACPSTSWREQIFIEEPAWHPDADLIAYPESVVEGGNYTRRDIFIESTDSPTSTCLHIKADGSMINKPGCTVRRVGDYLLRNEVAWTCDGQSLLVNAQSSLTDDRAIYIIKNVLTATQLSLEPLRLTAGKQSSLSEQAAQRTCP